MTKTIRKTSIVLALLMAFLMVFTLLPLNVKAQESIEIMQADLDAVGPDKESHVDLEKGIEYYDSGGYELYKSAEYVLKSDIVLTDASLLISSERGQAVLNLNGHSITSSRTSMSEGDEVTVACTRGPLTIKGQGSIVAGNNVDYALLSAKDITIEDGIYAGDVSIGGEDTSLSITGGNFEGELFIMADADISGGVFNDAVSVWGGTVAIYDGEFESLFLKSDNATMIIMGGSFYDTCTFNAGKGDIFGGNFEYKGDSNMIINLNDAYLDIWDGDFYNSANSENDPAKYIVFASQNNKTTSLNIYGGYFGVSENIAVVDEGINNLGIYGGEFVSKGYAIFNFDNGNSNVKIAGGKFTSLGTWSLRYIPSAAIVTNFAGGVEYKDDLFESYLSEGYEYVPGVETNKAFDGDVVRTAYTQLELSVLPKEANLVYAEENADLNQQVNALINKLKSGESVEGISPELAEMILDAIAEGKDISVEMSVTPVNPEDVKEDSEKVTALVGNDGKVAAYFDVNIAINIEGETVGFVTKLDDGVLIKLPIPEGLPNPESGLLREWKIVRVHNGIASELSAEAGDGYVSGKSAEFSTYALVYNDAATPATGDFGITPWLIIITAAAASSLIVVSVRKFKNE